MHVRAAVLPLIAVAGFAVFAQKHAAMSFDDAVKAAEANAATPEGRVYAAEVSRHFDEQHLTSLKECTQAANEPEMTRFTLALKIGRKGRVDEVLVKPETRVAVCMARGAVKDHLKKPPSAGYWVAVTLTPTK